MKKWSFVVSFIIIFCSAKAQLSYAEKLATTIRDVMADPEFQAAARQQYLPLRFIGPDEHQALLLRMQDEYRRVWAERPWRE